MIFLHDSWQGKINMNHLEAFFEKDKSTVSFSKIGSKPLTFDAPPAYDYRTVQYI